MTNATVELDTEEIAKIFNVTRQHVTNRLTKRMDFPPPSTNVSRRIRRWRRTDVLDYKAGKRWNRALS